MGITKKQKEFFDYVDKYIKKNGYSPTQQEIKEHLDLKSLGSIQRYIRYLIDAGYLINDWNARRGLIVVFDPQKGPLPPHLRVPQSSEFEIPLLGNVAAGNPIEAIENADEQISVPKTMLKSGKEYFAFKVKGDSMIDDGIIDDDFVICEKTQSPNQCRNGDRVVALINNEATLKKYTRIGNRIELHPANENYKPIIIEKGDFFVFGILKGLIRQY